MAANDPHGPEDLTPEQAELYARFVPAYAARVAQAERIVVVMDFHTAWSVLGCVQLALKHSENTGAPAVAARAFCDYLIHGMDLSPVLAEVAERGFRE